MKRSALTVGIVDYGLGNLFSVQQACEHAGLRSVVTSSRAELSCSAAIILPGVGAFGDAMGALKRLQLLDVLSECAESGRPFWGICLGMQLLMTESYEFGHHYGLGFIEGPAVKLNNSMAKSDASLPRRTKVPHVGWSQLRRPSSSSLSHTRLVCQDWSGSPLEGVHEGDYMYFIHSYYVQPKDAEVVLSVTDYGGISFCSSLQRGNIFGCQFHPERSGGKGIQIYRNLGHLLRETM